MPNSDELFDLHKGGLLHNAPYRSVAAQPLRPTRADGWFVRVVAVVVPTFHIHTIEHVITMVSMAVLALAIMAVVVGLVGLVVASYPKEDIPLRCHSRASPSMSALCCATNKTSPLICQQSLHAHRYRSCGPSQ